MKPKPNVYAVILAGGGGTRLWPLSRTVQPKHLLTLWGEQTMLRQTYERVQPLIPPERVMAITVAGHERAVQEQMPGVPAANIVAEPLGRSTGPCVGLMAALIQQRDPGAIMVSLHADQVIQDEAGFRGVLQTAIGAAEEDHLVTVGIVPTEPATGYGYIQRGLLLGEVDGRAVYRVERFTEKPDQETAQSFIEIGDYFWNSGIFVWKVSAVLQEFRRWLPQLYGQLTALGAVLDTARRDEEIARVWNEVEPVSIDVGIMERAHDVVVIPADIGWSDVGCWTSVADLSCQDDEGNVARGPHVLLDCQDTFVHSSGRLVAAMGVQGLVIVETPEAVLVCPKELAQEVKQIVERLKEDGWKQYL